MNIIISNSANEPIYLQIINQIKSQILTGDLKEGQALPSIRSLAKELEISVITTKRAYDELEKDGFIVTVAGKGSYVAPVNTDILKEKKMKMVEQKLSETITEAKLIGMSLEELKKILELLYEG
ncbi:MULTISPECIES: GntR family transcriptional regulator [Bacillaceae]|uniref:GntR family transcriptional regulator n=1 Tax=Caldibacillus thermoamylovorans TaxID=35841 RepID=A0A090IPX1_9BACI|nr:GntR family transcriptional regulator [Caldibacillus thermoamylovorans]MCM3055308.1 GntR family transcriptional regulator [Caldibacillus thermoamylovorans]CEE00106.1 GntR family transcriptional regulator [Caldibacillus thermoamylovorans]